jgi:hypothetical protein
LETTLERALQKTIALWEPVEVAYGWVHAAARILANEAGDDGLQVRRRYQGLLGAMQRWRVKAGDLEPAIGHFLKVTRSYWPGLFHCYEVPDLPRTNNDLEHLFGSHRYHERRATGRKTASPALVLRGPVRIVAAVATRLRSFSAADLAVDVDAWRSLRAELDRRRQQRVQQRRFRRNPEAYLADLETQLVKLILPP